MSTSPTARTSDNPLGRLLPILTWSAWAAAGFILLIWLHEVGHALSTLVLRGEPSIPLIGTSGPVWALAGRAPSTAYYGSSSASQAAIKLAGPSVELGLCFAAAFLVWRLSPRGRWLAFLGGMALVPLVFRAVELASMAVSGWNGDLQEAGQFLGRDIAAYGYPLWVVSLIAPAFVYLLTLARTDRDRVEISVLVGGMSVLSAFAFALGFIGSSVVASHL